MVHLLTQGKYAKKLLAKIGMTDCKPIATPMASETRSLAYKGDIFPHSTQYRSAIRAHQYLTITCLDMFYAINKVP